MAQRHAVSNDQDPVRTSPPRLVGRAKQYREIVGVLEQALEGGQELLQLVGPRGSGRTRLLGETIRMAHTFGFDISADSGGGVDAAGHSSVRSTAPLFVAVDDADTLRAEQLDAVLAVARCRSRRVVLATTASCTRPIAAFPRTTKVLLDPLDADGAEAMVTDLVGTALGDDLRRLITTAGGNPWLLDNLITGLRAERRITLQDRTALVRGDAVPELVTTAIADRLAELSAPCRRLVNAVAVAAAPVPPAVLGTIIDCDVTATLAVADEANAAGLLGYLHGVIWFHNVLTRRVVLAAIPPAVRVAMTRLATDAGIAATADPIAGHLSAVPLIDDETAETPVQAAPMPADQPRPWHRLSDMERAIAALVSQGMTNRQIANRVFLSPHTVNYHLRGIFRKLQVCSRVELAAVVRERPAPADELDSTTW